MRKKTMAAVFATAALGVPAGAQAHVSVHPNFVPAGANVTLSVRVPNEEEKAVTTKVDVAVPPGFLDASPQVLPGWTAEVKHTKLAKPVQTDDGTLTEQVSEIVWTADSAKTGIPPEQFMTF